MKFSLPKIWLVTSLAILSFMYGYTSRTWEWFPHDYVVQAWNQAKAIESAVRGLPPYANPVVYDRHGVLEIRPDRREPGPTLIATNWKGLGWDPAVRLLTADGEVLHQWKTTPEKIHPSLVGPFGDFRDFGPPFGFHLFQNGDLLTVGLEQMARLNACGKVIWRVTDPQPHHDLSVERDGSIWVSARREERVSFSGLEGFEIEHDYILHVSEQGEVLKEISVLEVLYENGFQDRIFRFNSHALAVEHGDITHLNDVEVLPDIISSKYPKFEAGDILISLREIHLIIILDPETKKVKWSSSDSFIHQHDPDFIGDGWIAVFDNHWDETNRGRVLGGSRITAIHTSTDSVRTLFPTSISDTLYTRTAGRWQKLKNGNLLLTESKAGRVLEVTESGKNVWEWVNKSEKSLVPEVYGATRVDLTRSDIASWPCSLVDSISTSPQSN